MPARSITILWLLWCWNTTQAQDGSRLKFQFCAATYCKSSEKPLEGLLITLIGRDGHRDSLFTDSLGVARTRTGSDTLELRPGNAYQVEVSRPNGPIRLRDTVTTDTLNESTAFIKEYFPWDCSTPSTDHRWLPPSVYFAVNSALPRNDSSWYQQEAQVNSVDDAIGAIVQVMKDNPTLIIRAIGSCDVREKDCTSLALARANYVKNRIVDHGISADRLETEGRTEAYRYSEAEIATMKNRQEREDALARDRQVRYLVVSMDYKQ